MLFAFALSFMKWDGNNPIEFIGLQNFTKMLEDIRFKAALKNTIIYSITTVPMTLVCGLILAIILNQGIKFKNFLELLVFPYVASLVAVASVWNMLLVLQMVLLIWC